MADQPVPAAADLAAKLHDTTDALVWAEEFIKVIGGAVPPSSNGWPAIEVGLMVTWFANAIETGRGHGRYQFREHMRAAADAVYFGHFPPETTDEPVAHNGGPSHQWCDATHGYCDECEAEHIDGSSSWPAIGAEESEKSRPAPRRLPTDEDGNPAHIDGRDDA